MYGINWPHKILKNLIVCLICNPNLAVLVLKFSKENREFCVYVGRGPICSRYDKFVMNQNQWKDLSRLQQENKQRISAAFFLDDYLKL